MPSAVNYDKGIAANDYFKQSDKRKKCLTWKWMIVLAYGIANVCELLE